MSLPPALLARLTQRGLVQKESAATTLPTENDEVIVEDYDGMEMEEQQQGGPERYDHVEVRQQRDDNTWRDRMKARMSDFANIAAGHKGCPNKYNIWHKCTLFCLNRWGDGIAEPGHIYNRRYKRLLRKYPLPNNWMEMYDPGCGAYYFYCENDNVVSWLPPTHPKSYITKPVTVLRGQLDETGSVGGNDGDGSTSEDEETDDNKSNAGPAKESANIGRHQHEIDSIINASMRKLSTPPIPTATSSIGSSLIGRDFERGAGENSSRTRRGRDHHGGSGRGRRGREEALDPMDPSAYSDIPRGKWSDGLIASGEDARKKLANREDKKKHTAQIEDNDDGDDDDNDADDDDNDESVSRIINNIMFSK